MGTPEPNAEMVICALSVSQNAGAYMMQSLREKLVLYECGVDYAIPVDAFSMIASSAGLSWTPSVHFPLGSICFEPFEEVTAVCSPKHVARSR